MQYPQKSTIYYAVAGGHETRLDPDDRAGTEPAMNRNMFNGKIHRARVTHANLEYEGSVTIDSDLMRAADILPHESVHIWNLTRGSRLQTYALPGTPGSGLLCVNGAAAHLNRPGDLVIVATFVELDDEEARLHHPKVVRVDAENRIIGEEPELPGPHLARSRTCGSDSVRV